jgi:hypothetical protein
VKWFRREPPGRPEVFGKAADRDHMVTGDVETWSDGVPDGASLLGVTEVVIVPGGSDEWPVADGTDVLTWVVAGELQHTDGAAGCTGFAGTLLHGSADQPGHRDTNTGTEPLRLLRFTVRRGGSPRPACGPVRAPVLVAGGGALEVLTQRTELEVPAAHLHTIDGVFSVAGTPLRPGDWVRLFTTRTLEGEGLALAWVPADAGSLAWSGATGAASPARPG